MGGIFIKPYSLSEISTTYNLTSDIPFHIELLNEIQIQRKKVNTLIESNESKEALLYENEKLDNMLSDCFNMTEPPGLCDSLFLEKERTFCFELHSFKNKPFFKPQIDEIIYEHITKVEERYINCIVTLTNSFEMLCANTLLTICKAASREIHLFCFVPYKGYLAYHYEHVAEICKEIIDATETIVYFSIPKPFNLKKFYSLQKKIKHKASNYMICHYNTSSSVKIAKRLVPCVHNLCDDIIS